MLRFLREREAGLLNPKLLEKAESTRRVFSLELSKYHDVQKIHDGAVNSLDVDLVEDRYLLSGAANGTVVIHDLQDLADIPQYTHPEVCHVGRGNPHRPKYSIETVQWYSHDTGMFMTSGMDKLLKIWDTNTLTVADEFQFSGGIYAHDMSQVAKQHSLVAAGTQSSKVRLIDLKSGSATHILRGHRQSVLAVKWSTRDEFIVATGSEDNKVLVWDIRNAKGALLVLDQHNGDTSAGPNSVNTAHSGFVNSLCFTPDGTHLLSFGTDNHIRLWSSTTGQNSMVNFGRIRNESKKGVSMAVCDYSKPSVLLVPSDNDIEMFDLYTGMGLKTLIGHYNQVNACVFHASCQNLYSCGNDRNILIWKPHLETIQAYEEHIQQGSKEKEQKSSGFVRRIGAGAADAWSSDED